MKQEPIDTVLIKAATVDVVDNTGAGSAELDCSGLSELAEALRQVTGENAAWAARIRPESRLEGDLGLDSLELAELDGILRDRHGNGVDLMDHLAGMDIDQIIGLTVGDLLVHLADASASSGLEGQE